MSTALVVGASGAFGRILCQRLSERGTRVYRASRRMQPSGDTFSLDIAQADDVAAVVGKVRPDQIFHLAATFTDDFDEALSVNVRGARNVLAAAAKLDKPVRVILAGSAAEYGVVQPQENPLAEDRELRPASTYGLTKAWQTQLGLHCARNGQDVVVGRIFNLKGPGLSQRLFIGRIQAQIEEIKAGQRTRIEIGALDAVRDYVDIDHAADQLIAVARRGMAGQVYHVASGRPVRMRDLLQELLQANGIGMDHVHESPENSRRTGYDVPVAYANISKTSALLARTNGD